MRCRSAVFAGNLPRHGGGWVAYTVGMQVTLYECIICIVVFWVLTACSLSSVSEEHVASIFTVEFLPSTVVTSPPYRTVEPHTDVSGRGVDPTRCTAVVGLVLSCRLFNDPEPHTRAHARTHTRLQITATGFPVCCDD
jgi:hypothetical protein